MRILLLGFAKLKIMPYAHFYLNQIDCSQNDVHLIYWNRDLQEEDVTNFAHIHLHEFKTKIDDGIRKRDKLKYFADYRRFVKSKLKEFKFDFIISLHTLPGLLVLDKLLTNFKHQYILDYRDSTFENNRIFGLMVKLLALNAKCVFTSSDAFRKFLPVDNVEVITSHNILLDSLNHRDNRICQFVPNDKVRISFWGKIRHYSHNLLNVIN